MRQQLAGFFYPRQPVTYAKYDLLVDLNDSSSFGNAATFTRTTSKFYRDDDDTFSTVAIDTAVFMDDGIFIENASTNSVEESVDTHDAWWLKENLNTGSTTALAPDGSFTARELTENTATGVHRILKVGGFSGMLAGSYRALSGYVKKGDKDYLIIVHDVGSRWCSISLVTGAVTIQDNASYPWHVTVEQVDNGYWYFRVISRSSTAIAGFVLNNAEGTNYPSDAQYTGTNGVLSHTFWGLQYEYREGGNDPELAYASSLIQTAGAAGFRDYDLVTIPSSHFASNDFCVKFTYKANGYADIDTLYSHRTAAAPNDLVQCTINNRTDGALGYAAFIVNIFVGGVSILLDIPLSTFNSPLDQEIDAVYDIEIIMSSTTGKKFTVTKQGGASDFRTSANVAGLSTVPLTCDVGCSLDRSAHAKGWIKNLVIEELIE